MKFTKYEKYGAYHWKQYADPNSKYHRHANRVEKWIQERNCLDIGAGDGRITALLNITGIDDEKEAVKLAREKFARVTLGDAYDVPCPDESYDAVFMGDVLEHIEFPEMVLVEARRILKKCLYIASPIPGMQNDPFHYQEWTPTELVTLIEPSGFRLMGEILEVPRDKRMYAKFTKVPCS